MDLLCQQTRRNTLVSWPQEVDERLNVLVRSATAAGEHTSRAQVLAALVSLADTQPEAVSRLLHAYRQLPADALSDGNDRDDLPTVRAPGRTRTSPNV